MKKILVIDDSKTIRKLCEMIHRGLDDKILTAGSAAEAENIIKAENPEVIFVDYTLPDADVYEWIASHVGDNHGIVMMGGTYADCNADLAKEKGAVDVIIKPFKTDDYFNAEEAAYSAAKGGAAEPAPQTAPITMPPAPPTAPLAPGAAAAKRFNFPVGSSPANTAVAPEPLPERPVAAPAAKNPDEATPVSPNSGVVSKPATVSSVSNVSVSGASSALNAVPEGGSDIDPAIRAEIVAAVKQLLPAYVAHYVKKLIQQEIKPQLQTWVDARVETLINKH